MEDIFGNPILAALFAVVAPFVVSLLTRCHWSDTIKQVVAIAVSFAFGALALWLRVVAGGADWTPEAVIVHLTGSFAIATAVYWFILKGSGTPAAALNRRLQLVGAGPESKRWGGEDFGHLQISDIDETDPPAKTPAPIRPPPNPKINEDW